MDYVAITLLVAVYLLFVLALLGLTLVALWRSLHQETTAQHAQRWLRAQRATKARR